MICAEWKFSLIVGYAELDQENIWASSSCCVVTTDIKKIFFFFIKVTVCNCIYTQLNINMYPVMSN